MKREKPGKDYLKKLDDGAYQILATDDIEYENISEKSSGWRYKAIDAIESQNFIYVLAICESWERDFNSSQIHSKEKQELILGIKDKYGGMRYRVGSFDMQQKIELLNLVEEDNARIRLAYSLDGKCLEKIFRRAKRVIPREPLVEEELKEVRK